MEIRFRGMGVQGFVKMKILLQGVAIAVVRPRVEGIHTPSVTPPIPSASQSRVLDRTFVVSIRIVSRVTLPAVMTSACRSAVPGTMNVPPTVSAFLSTPSAAPPIRSISLSPAPAMTSAPSIRTAKLPTLPAVMTSACRSAVPGTMNARTTISV